MRNVFVSSSSLKLKYYEVRTADGWRTYVETSANRQIRLTRNLTHIRRSILRCEDLWGRRGDALSKTWRAPVSEPRRFNITLNEKWLPWKDDEYFYF